MDDRGIRHSGHNGLVPGGPWAFGVSGVSGGARLSKPLQGAFTSVIYLKLISRGCTNLALRSEASEGPAQSKAHEDTSHAASS